MNTTALSTATPSRLAPIPPPAAPVGTNSTGGVEQTFLDMLRSAHTGQASAEQHIGQFLAGGDVTQTEVLTAVKKAELSLMLMMQVRNKLLESFNELRQMQL